MQFPRTNEGRLEASPIKPPMSPRRVGRVASKEGKKRVVPLSRGRSYTMGDLDNTIGWNPKEMSADSAIEWNIDSVRARARDLARNNPYCSNFIRNAVSNVVGSEGITFQGRLRFNGGKKAGKLDKAANNLIERIYRSACKAKNKPTRDGRKSMKRAQDLWLRSLIIDGEVIVMFHPGSSKNSSRFQVEFIEPSRLDWTLTSRLANGNKIRMGVETDEDDEPVAYWILEDDPNDTLLGGGMRHRHRRVEAKHIRHTFVEEQAGQTRGITHLASAGLRAHLIEAFEKATVIGGIVAARKVGFYKINQEKAEDYGVLGNEIEGSDDECEDVNDDANLIHNVEDGQFEQLPSYVDGLESFDTDYPPANFEEFEKRMIRGMAAGFGGQYHSVANDLEGVNYSSIRAGELEQREVWKGWQKLLTEEFLEFHFEGWGMMLSIRNDIKVDRLKLSKMLDQDLYEFVPRGWAWVDPLKEMNANEKALKLFLTSRNKITTESCGRDFSDIFDEAAEEEEMMRARGIEPWPEENKQNEQSETEVEAGPEGDPVKEEEEE